MKASDWVEWHGYVQDETMPVFVRFKWESGAIQYLAAPDGMRQVDHTQNVTGRTLTHWMPLVEPRNSLDVVNYPDVVDNHPGFMEKPHTREIERAIASQQQHHKTVMEQHVITEDRITTQARSLEKVMDIVNMLIKKCVALEDRLNVKGL